MDAFQMYVSLGIQHIADLQGYDHLVFLVALCTIYSFNDWKKILAIITLFTIGHTITLFIAAFGLVNVHGPTIELLIALTILITGISNLTKRGQRVSGKRRLILGGTFGLIHGLGFSRYYNMIAEGTNPWVSLPAFTLGIELGQIIIVIAYIILAWLIENAFSITKRDWNLGVSGGVIGIALIMVIERLPDVF
jgi:uncharacterized membrane protein